jgi:transcriptional regulator of arginine metabolism
MAPQCNGRRSPRSAVFVNFPTLALDFICAFRYFYAHIYAFKVLKQGPTMPHTNTEQTERRDTIRDLLSDGPVGTQQDLVRRLSAMGLAVTQSSVSRDLKDLGAVKTGDGYELPNPGRDGERELAAVASLIRRNSPAGPHLLVIRTAIGAAQRVALALDRTGWPEIVGNIGGDDTVFVATASATGQKQLVSKIDRATSR